MTVRRWTRYGKDRLYVTTAHGVQVGWLDVVTGHATLEQPHLAAAFHEAIGAHQTAVAAPFPVLDPVEASTGLDEPLESSLQAPVPSAADWTDIALNRPGQGVRAQADSLLAGTKADSRVRTFLARALDVKTDERAFRVGADGEEAIGARLDRLTRHGCRVLHSIPVGKGTSDIDHLVITQRGVYPVNTKRHPGGRVWVGDRAILVNGHKTDYLRNSRYEADRVKTTLLAHLGEEIPVRAVLVILTGTVLPQITIKQMPDVLVLDRTDVPGVFERAPERMSGAMIERVYEVARRSTTWTG